MIRRGTLSRGRWKRVRGWARACTDLVFPPQCAFCERELESGVEGPMLCASCRGRLAPPITALCARCAAPLELAPSAAPAAKRGRCPYCRDAPIAFRGAVALGVYTGDLQTAVLRMKDERNERLAFALGSLLAERVGEPLDSADVIVPVPMLWRRRIVRKVNSPELMADALSCRLGMRRERGVLWWRRNVAVQSSLPPGQRRRNVSGALGVRAGHDLSGAHILLVDDIMTTGATANAATRVLQRAGAARVSVAVAARGIGSN